MTVVLAAALAVALYLLPLLIATPLLAGRWRSRSPALALDAALVLAVDVYAVLLLARVMPLGVAAWVSRGAWAAVGAVAWYRARPSRAALVAALRGVDMETARPAATLAAVTVAFLSTLSYGYVIWDREAHIPLVSSLRTQSFPFDWALVPVAPLKYHYLGDAIAAMLQSLSGDVITAALALTLAHDIFLALAPVTVFLVLRALGARAGAGWLGALAFGVLLAGPLSFLRDDAHHPFTTTGSLSLCGNTYLCFLTLSYRPAMAPGVYFLVVPALALAVRLAPASRGVLRDGHAAALMVASVAALALLDETSLGLLGLGLGAAWLVFPDALGRTRARGAALLVGLAVTIVVVTVVFHGVFRDTLLGALHRALHGAPPPGGGAPVQDLKVVPARLLGIYGQRAYSLLEAAGRRELFFDAFPSASVALLAAWFAMWLRSRAIAGLAVFMGAVTTVGLLGLFKVDVNNDPSESQRFVTAPMLLAPVVGAMVLVLAAGRATAARAVMLVALGLPALSTLLWYKSFVIETAAQQRAFGDVYSRNCREAVGAPLRGRPALRYVSAAAIWRYAPCQPTLLPGRRSTGWDVSLLNAYGPEAIDSVRRSDPRAPLASVVCLRSASDSDPVCEWARRNTTCASLGAELTECPLSAAARAALLQAF